MSIEDRQGKKDVEQNTSRPAENQRGAGTTSQKSGDDAAIAHQQQETRDAAKKTLGR